MVRLKDWKMNPKCNKWVEVYIEYMIRARIGE